VFSLCCLSPVVTAQYTAFDPAAVAAARGSFVDRLVAEHAFDRAELELLLGSATIDESILRAIARPAERVVPWYEYREIFLNDARITAGAEFWRDHRDRVETVAERYAVDPEVILAIVGVESLFGERMGRYRVLDALSTLAFAYPPRARFFGSELEAFLLMGREEGPEFLQGLGSYAGAMGAGQFIPTSYRAYAVDGDGDGRRDLWGNWDDILASVANYLARHGWQGGAPVAVPATRRPQAVAGQPSNKLELESTVSELAAAGYDFEVELELDQPATVIGYEQDADSTEYWAGFRNFYVITRYNRSWKYALAAHQLSQAIREAYMDIDPAQSTPAAF
jgi:membrane-bound lytic murein transglycosylase B